MPLDCNFTTYLWRLLQFFALVWENLKDPVIIILIIAALVSFVPVCRFGRLLVPKPCIRLQVSTVLGASIAEQRKHGEWIEGVAIWVAIVLVVSVSKSHPLGSYESTYSNKSLVEHELCCLIGIARPSPLTCHDSLTTTCAWKRGATRAAGAGNDYQKDRQFRKLNAQKDVIMVTVVRGGHTELVENTQLVVGDVYLLDTGDKVVADGICFDSQGLIIDEASLTGESDPIKKHPEEDCWVRSGTQVRAHHSFSRRQASGTR